MIQLNKLLFASSFLIVALGQPARVGWLGALAAVCGFALFFHSLSPHLSSLRRFGVATLWFAAVQLVQLSWMTAIAFQGYYILCVYACLCIGIGSQFGLLTLLVPASGHLSFRTILFCASFWTLMEWIRLFFLCGFSWNPTGLSLTHFTCSMQCASVFGIFGLTFLVMATNLLCLRAFRCNTLSVNMLQLSTLALLPYCFGALHMHFHIPHSAREEKTLNVALVQTNWLPSQKNPQQGRLEEFIPPMAQWEQIITALKGSEGAKNWDLIVLPEAAVASTSERMLYAFDQVEEVFVSTFGPEIESSFPPGYNSRVSNLFWCHTLASYFNAECVVGLDHVDRARGENYNSAFYFAPGRSSAQHYDKQVLLPLAEYLPFTFLKPLTKSYGISDFFTQGQGAKVWGQKVPFSTSICYEETFPEVMREGRRKGAQLFINVTNDNYYPNSTLHEQHLFHARVRAVENGVPLIRSCNAGISAAIDSFGRISARQDASLDACSVLSHSLNPYTYPTLYTLWGDVGILTLCLMGLLLRANEIFTWFKCFPKLA